MKTIPGGTSQLQSCPSECADRVCLCHSGASVIHADTPHHTAQGKRKLPLLNPQHTAYTACVNFKCSFVAFAGLAHKTTSLKRTRSPQSILCLLRLPFMI